MFISKLSLPRRTFLRGLGVTAGAAVARRDGAGADRARRRRRRSPPLRFGAVYVPQRRRSSDQWTPTTVGSRLRVHADPEAARAVPRPASSWSATSSGSAASARPITRRSIAAWLSGAIAKRTEGEDVRAGTTIDQIIAKQIGQDTPFPSLEAGDRELHGLRRRLQHRLQLRVHEHALVGDADHAAADGDQSARRVRAAVRPRRHAGPAPRARMQEDRSILDSHRRGRQRAAARARRRAIASGSASISTTSARSSGGSSGPRRRTASTCRLDAPIGIPDVLRRARGADVRPAGGGLSGRPHARLHVHDGARSQQPHLSRRSASPTGHHELSHHGNKPEEMAAHAKLNTYHMQQFAKFVEKLQGHARRRRHAARSLADRLRQRHEQRQRPYR